MPTTDTHSPSALTPLVTRQPRTDNNFDYYDGPSTPRGGRGNCCEDLGLLLLLALKYSMYALAYKMANTGLGLVYYSPTNYRATTSDCDAYSAYARGMIDGGFTPDANFLARIVYNTELANPQSLLTAPYLLGVHLGASSRLLVMTMVYAVVSPFRRLAVRTAHTSRMIAAFMVVFLTRFYSTAVFMAMYEAFPREFDAVSQLVKHSNLSEPSVLKGFFAGVPDTFNPVSDWFNSIADRLYGLNPHLSQPGRNQTGFYFSPALSSNTVLASAGLSDTDSGVALLVTAALLSGGVFMMGKAPCIPHCFKNLFRGYPHSYIKLVNKFILKHSLITLLVSAVLSFVMQFESVEMLMLLTLAHTGILSLNPSNPSKDSARSMLFAWAGITLGGSLVDMHRFIKSDVNSSALLVTRGFILAASLSVLVLGLDCFKFKISQSVIKPTDAILNRVEKKKSFACLLPSVMGVALFSGPMLLSLVLSMSVGPNSAVCNGPHAKVTNHSESNATVTP